MYFTDTLGAKICTAAQKVVNIITYFADLTSPINGMKILQTARENARFCKFIIMAHNS